MFVERNSIEKMSENRAMAMKRIKRELDEIKKNPPAEVMAGPSNDDLFVWEGMLNGPEDSPYAGGVFKFVIHFKEDHPMSPPDIKFITKVYHPNVGQNGKICIDILQNNWSSVYTVSNVMLSILSLLTDPNCSSPLNPESAELYMNDRKAYNKTVKQWVKKYASAENPL